MNHEMVRDEEKNKAQGHAYAKGHDKQKADEPTSGTGDDIGGSCCTPPGGGGGADTKP